MVSIHNTNKHEKTPYNLISVSLDRCIRIFNKNTGQVRVELK